MRIRMPTSARGGGMSRSLSLPPTSPKLRGLTGMTSPKGLTSPKGEDG